ncbi:fumarylacetoacetate hydrolase family protein [Elioraea rosea]|uniref:fumarylacetoacetate hydrolase family protein n=1 Tax=Elioraea rosea TaxID=2492390 RepID=UPI0011865B25|nr:fumarylacetoacetate hydrolase family protein [Elioraea rosea]
MKLLRWGPKGSEKPGMLDTSGALRDLSGVVSDITPELLSPAGLARLAAVKADALPKVEGTPRLGTPFTGTRNFICIGLNYADHAAESNMPIPAEPVVFIKALSALSGPNDDIEIPKFSKKTDWEVELGIVIGTRAKYVEEANALEHVAGYCVVNDVSEREFQLERGMTWDKGKGHDTFGPVGPWLVTKDEVADPQDLRLGVDVDGQVMQDGTTKTMIFPVTKLVSYVSHFISLNPGDIIATGTPPGVGAGKKPNPIFLRAGQTMRVWVEGLGEQNAKTVQAG